MVKILRHRQSKKMLQQAMNCRRMIEISPAHDLGDALARIIGHDRYMIARADVLAHQHDIAPGLRMSDLRDGRSRASLHESERRTELSTCKRHVDPPGSRITARKTRVAEFGRYVPAGTGIERLSFGIARGIAAGVSRYVLARAEARIEQAPVAQGVLYRMIALEMLAL